MKTYSLRDMTNRLLSEIVTLQHEPVQPAFWDTLSQDQPTEDERVVNEATIWARAIYPLLALAERDSIRAWSEVPLSATFDWAQPSPVMTVLSSREYMEKNEAATILTILKSIVARYVRGA